MIREIISQWDERKSVLRAHLQENHPGGYADLLDRILRLVVNEPIGGAFSDSLDPDCVTVVDDGHYQGVQLFLIPLGRYQPGPDDYVWFDNYYGSCSGCDTYQSIRGYYDEPPTPDQVEQYMSLALHMVQRMKWLVPREAA